MSNPNPRSAELNPRARNFLDRHIRNASGRRAQPREAVNTRAASASGTGASSLPVQAEKPYQAAQREGQAYAPAMILRKFRLLEGEYLKALPVHTEMAPALTLQYDIAKRAIEAGDMGAAATALGDLESAIKLLPPLRGVPKTRPIGAQPLTAEAATVLEAASKTGPVGTTPLEVGASVTPEGLRQELLRMKDEVDNLSKSRIGGDLKVFYALADQQLKKKPFGVPESTEAQALLKELRIKMEFVRKRDKEVESRRGKLAEYGNALQAKFQIPPGLGARLLADKSLKAGGHFTDFATALKDHEKNANDKSRAALAKAVDSYLRHYEKFSDADRKKPENDKKLKEVLAIKDSFSAEALISSAADLRLKDATEWTREDQTRGTEQHLAMMLLLSDAPPKNLKGANSADMVMQINGMKDKPKLVVKPISAEKPVHGFPAGGGAGREMLASVMGDKLQEMLGIDLNVAATKLVTVDGGKIGLERGTPVTASVQAFVKDAETLGDRLDAVLDVVRKEAAARNEDTTKDFQPAAIKRLFDQIPVEEVQNKGIFDLIAMHCDRHAGNFMVGADNKLVPIDHGNILPSKAGLLARAQQMGPPHAVLASCDAAKRKLGPEQVERIERLNTDELLDTMKSAHAAMRKATPDADVGNIDEGLDNARRSIEFMKFAARKLTLEAIYCAYGKCADDIFFTDEKNKLAGFAKAVAFAETFMDASAELTSQVSQFFGNVAFEDLLPQVQALGWFPGMDDVNFREWARANPQKVRKIIKDKLKPPRGTQAPVKQQVSPPDTFNGEQVKGQEIFWERYQEFGGDAAWAKLKGASQKAKLMERAEQLELALYHSYGGDAKTQTLGSKHRSAMKRYADLGGNAAWVKAGGSKEGFGARVERLERDAFMASGGDKQTDNNEISAIVERYVAVGGDTAWAKAGGSAKTPIRDRVLQLEKAAYDAAGGDLAWLRCGLSDDNVTAKNLYDRALFLQSLKGAEAIPLA
ncbi:MAG: hypothetical protein ABIN08_09175 [Caldimonas sp.]